MAEKIATREAYGSALAEFGHKYNIVVFDADLAEATKTIKFKKEHPERFFDCGIAESNMVGVAAGAAAAGMIPFVSSFAMFAAGRAFEQIRNSVAYPQLNVKIGATHAGITVGEDGATHQCLEDLALMRSIPGMVVLNPADAVEARAAVEAAILHNGPVYMRFGRAAVPVLFDQSTFRFEIGRGIVLAEGTDVTIAASGVMVEQALIARDLLANDGISARVINCCTIKPIDTALLVSCAKETGCIVTAEEHSVIGGFGSAVAETLSESCPVPVLRVGTEDVFGRSGKVPPLMELYGLTAQNIAAKAKIAVSLKK
ncbi:MAG: transketolase family protein [Clostridia bacterium]|nr:transketolase family protein [Clostridia bacterium]MBO5670439.1 transketolase family protein [Clostridia bacterium]